MYPRTPDPSSPERRGLYPGAAALVGIWPEPRPGGVLVADAPGVRRHRRGGVRAGDTTERGERSGDASLQRGPGSHRDDLGHHVLVAYVAHGAARVPRRRLFERQGQLDDVGLVELDDLV